MRRPKSDAGRGGCSELSRPDVALDHREHKAEDKEGSSAESLKRESM